LHKHIKIRATTQLRMTSCLYVSHHILLDSM